MKTQCSTRRNGHTGVVGVMVATLLGNSLPLLAPPGPGCPADFDGNGAVGPADLAIVLGAWGGAGPADLDGDGIVAGSDLATLLGAWGDCPAACAGYTDMSFAGESVDLAPLGLPSAIVLDGTVSVFPNGMADGSIAFTLPNGATGMIEIHPGVVAIAMPDVLLDLAPFAPIPVVLVNGVPTPVASVLSVFESDMMSGAPLDLWAPTSRATLALVGLSLTDEWHCNVAEAQAAPFKSLGQGFWCKTTAYAAAAAITVLATAGCTALTAGCAGASTITVGGMVVPCVWAIGLCAGGVFIGAAATYEGVLAFWGDEQD